MRAKTIRRIGGLFMIGFVFLVNGCGDDVRTTKTVQTHEQEPVRMVSPGDEVVE